MEPNCRYSTGRDHRALQQQTCVIIQEKGRMSWKVIQRSQGCPSHHRPRLHRPRGEDCLHLSKGGATAAVTTCHAATTQSPGGLGSRATAAADPEGWASSQKLSSAVLGSNGICFTRFWTYLVPITSFFFPISPFGMGTSILCVPHHCI